MDTDGPGAAFGRNQIRNTNIEIRNNFKWQKTQCSKRCLSRVLSLPYDRAVLKSSIKNKKLMDSSTDWVKRER